MRLWLPRGQSRQPARKLTWIRRTGLSTFGSTSTIACHVPSCIRPASTGIVTDGDTRAGNDVVGAVAGGPVPVAVPGVISGHQLVEQGQQIVLAAGPRSQ